MAQGTGGGVVMNLYASQNPLAELVLANVWKKSAKAEGHMRRLPELRSEVEQKPRANSQAAAIRQYCMSHNGTFTIGDVAQSVPMAAKQNIKDIVSRLVHAKSLTVIGKDAHKCNIYRVAK